mmetsp:Transcript_32238/g.55152  ORF Transcript_32238/g.55152 Transcript_32238/m.55152 type:complete len:230 (-) Transcript_32238:233-922(-)
MLHTRTHQRPRLSPHHIYICQHNSSSTSVPPAVGHSTELSTWPRSRGVTPSYHAGEHGAAAERTEQLVVEGVSPTLRRADEVAQDRRPRGRRRARSRRLLQLRGRRRRRGGGAIEVPRLPGVATQPACCRRTSGAACTLLPVTRRRHTSGAAVAATVRPAVPRALLLAPLRLWSGRVSSAHNLGPRRGEGRHVGRPLGRVLRRVLRRVVRRVVRRLRRRPVRRRAKGAG